MSSKELWLEAPDGQFADSLKWTINEWDEEPKAVQILKTLVWCVYCGGASTFAMKCLNLELDIAMKSEGTTMEELKLLGALIWRNDEPFTD